MNKNYHQELDQFLKNAKMLRSRPGYDLYVGILKSSSKKVFVKHFRGDGGFELAENTLTDYQFYYSALSFQEEYNVPRPVGVFSDHDNGGFYVCEWMYGINVASLLRFFKYSRFITEFILIRIGKWLFEFHNVNKIQYRYFGEIVDILVINKQIDVIENYLKQHNIDMLSSMFEIRSILNLKKDDSSKMPFTGLKF